MIAGTKILYRDIVGKRMSGFYRFPANDNGYLVVTHEREGNHGVLVHKSEVIAEV